MHAAGVPVIRPRVRVCPRRNSCNGPDNSSLQSAATLQSIKLREIFDGRTLPNRIPPQYCDLQQHRQIIRDKGGEFSLHLCILYFSTAISNICCYLGDHYPGLVVLLYKVNITLIVPRLCLGCWSAEVSCNVWCPHDITARPPFPMMVGVTLSYDSMGHPFQR